MTRLRKVGGAVWLIVAVLVAYGSTVGGDASIALGWLFVIWTAPFSIVWWFYLYDIARSSMAANVAQPLGMAIVIALAYAFWFWVVPLIWSKAKTQRAIQAQDAGS